MNKKHILKKLFCAFLILSIFFMLPPLCSAYDSADESEPTTTSENAATEENEFTFIKSNNADNSFFYNDNLLLYGGIGLVIISVIGIVVTLKPKKARNLRKSTRSGRR